MANGSSNTGSPIASRPTPNSNFNPSIFGRFYLLERLGVGGMAEIFRARVRGAGGFEKELVVKRILPAKARDEVFIAMLINEATLTVKLTHNNIAQIYECGKVDGNYFISMELVNGVTVLDAMRAFKEKGESFTAEQSIFIVLQLLQGLDYAHKKTDERGNRLNIIHCDISPDNAMLTYQGEVKLMDFGVARASLGLSNYRRGMVMGKMSHVAPEQASGDERWDHRVDIFATGVVLYEMLTGKKPFPQATDLQSLLAARATEVPPPSQVDDRLPPELDRIIKKALARDPEQRYPDASAFAKDLVNLLFPIPYSTIQDSIAQRMAVVFAGKIEKDKAQRQQDEVQMRALVSIGERNAREAAVERPHDGAKATRPVLYDALESSESTPKKQPPIVKRRGRGIPMLLAAPVAVLLLGVGAAAALYAEGLTRKGTLVVTSDPSGAKLVLDGVNSGQATPAVLDNVQLGRRHTIDLSGPRLRSKTVEYDAAIGKVAARLDVKMALAVVDVTVNSAPRGAAVLLDGKAVGRSPLSIPDVRVDTPHRIDLKLDGYQLDQFVFTVDKDGASFDRTLVLAN